MPVSVIFWVLLLIVLVIAFFALLPAVRGSIPPSRKPEPAGQPVTQESAPPAESAPLTDSAPLADSAPLTEAAPLSDAAGKAGDPVQEPLTEKPADDRTAEKTPQVPERDMPPETASRPQAPQAAPPETEKPAETRDRGVYFMQAGGGGSELLLSKVNRKLKVSDSPLLDSLNALLAGPTAEERGNGLVNMVPTNTRIISALVRGNTAYLNLNEEFRYNTYGREGSAAALRQIVWTATEFPNVQDVQIQIEGKIVDFLTEGVMIGSPLGRQ